jgi:hypothetical protein
LPAPKGGIIITTTELAAAYGVTRRCINRDCIEGVYPYTRHVISPKSHRRSYKIQAYIPFYPRETWQNLHRNSPSTFGDNEREAFLLAYGHLYSIRECCRCLHCDSKTIRSTYDKLFDSGYIAAAYTTLEEYNDAQTI